MLLNIYEAKITNRFVHDVIHDACTGV